jgi:hypothetical protein
MMLKVARQRGKLPRDVMQEARPKGGFTVKHMVDLYIENLRQIRQKKGVDDIVRFMANVVRPYGGYLAEGHRKS